MKLRYLITAFAFSSFVVTSAFGQNRDFRAERLVVDDGNGNTVIIQTPTGPITGGTLTLPDPNGSGQFVISNPSGGSQSVSGDFLPGTDDTYDLGSGAERWQDIFLSGIAAVAGAIQFQETGGGTDYVGFQAPAAVAASQIWTLPAADGTSGQLLSTDGSGVLNWTTISGTVNRNATLTGDGSVGSPLGINLGNSNTWTANQTFAGTFLITANSRIAMTNSDNNARDIRFQEPSGTGSQYIGLRAPSVTNNGNYVLPAVMGSAGEVLTLSTSNGIDSGTLAWAAGGASGAAGGDLTGTYPNPTIAGSAVTGAKIADSTITSADISATAAIAYSKLALNNSIQNADIVANAITTSKVANGTVTTSKLADSAVSGLKLLTFAVTNRHLASNSVTPDKVDPTGAASGDVLTYNGTNVVWTAAAGGATGAAGGDLTGTYPNPTIANDAITSAKIQDGQVQNSDLSANSVTTSKVANGTVTTSKMADSAISGLKLLTFAVTNRHLAGGAVTLDKISSTGAASGNVISFDGSNIVWTAAGGGATGAAGGDLTGTYPNPTIADNAITSAKIQDGQVQNSDLSANSVTTSKVANGTVTTSKMADSAISGLKLLTFAVTNRHLASGAVTPDKISSTGAVTGNVLRYNGTSVAWGSPASGGTSFNHTVVSATTYAVATTDDIIGCDVSANGITITLPAASSVPAGKTLVIRVENGDASVAGRAITINRNGTDLINYAQTSLTINQGTGVPGTAFRLYSDGVNQWWQW